jgi:hypothetical protein
MLENRRYEVWNIGRSTWNRVFIPQRWPHPFTDINEVQLTNIQQINYYYFTVSTYP